MVAFSPRGPRQRYARALSFAALAMAGLALTGCGGGARNAPRTTAEAVDVAPAAPAPDGFNKQNAESYGSVIENEFRSPLVAPLSTFSAEVNTASYANVRRFIQQQNKLPPRDAVLLAEMVNYFPYTYQPPTGDNPVSVTLDLSPCPWKPEHKLARIGVRSKDIAASELPPRNLVFLIDTSGSMGEENRLPLVKKALLLLTDTLTGRDRVTIVTYAGDAGVQLTPTSGEQKSEIRAAISRLGAGGGTNGEGGIKLAYEMARRSFVAGGANRVILCTDGDFNVGVSDQSSLQQLVEKERASGVFLSVLGFGMGNYKDDRLKLLANHGNGQHAYIDGMDEARKVFVEQGGALVCVAKDVKFQVEFNAAKVNAYRLIGYENRLMKAEDFKNDAKDAADIGSGYAVTALYEIVPVGVKIDLPGVDPLKYQKPAEKAAGGGDEWLTVKVRFKHPDGDKSRELSAVLKGEGGPMGEDFRFASAVAEFGLLLRDSPYKSGASFDAVLERANAALGADANGHRKEFVELVRKAKGLPRE